VDQADLYQAASLLPDFVRCHRRAAQDEDLELWKLVDKLKHLVPDAGLLQVECDQVPVLGQRGKAIIAYPAAAEVEFHKRVKSFQCDQFRIADLRGNRAEIHSVDTTAFAPP